MSTVYSAKIGSMPGTFVILRRNVVPWVKKQVYFKEVPSIHSKLTDSDVKYKKWQSGVIDDIYRFDGKVQRIFIGLM